jgi:NADPH:quinone reductase-like Zn-dependent oxidoreductase
MVSAGSFRTCGTACDGLASCHESGHLHAIRPTGSAATGGGRAPHAAPEPVCIRIVAAAVSVSECVVRGLKAPRRYRILFRLVAGWTAPRRILGMMLAGDIESVGRNVRSFKEGDQAFGMSRWAAGAYAEAVCWPANPGVGRRQRCFKAKRRERSIHTAHCAPGADCHHSAEHAAGSYIPLSPLRPRIHK